MTTEHPQADAEALARNVAAHVAGIVGEALKERRRATLAVSGGRSPIAMFRALGRMPLAWDQVSITLVDERWVPADAPDSNERLVREHLLAGPAAAARFVGLKADAPTPALAIARQTAALDALLPFDVVILGMGDDGHTASLFPGAAGLAAALDTTRPALLAAIEPPAAPHARLSLTLRGVLASRHIVLPIAGPQKRAVYQRAAHGASPLELPIAAVLRQHAVPVEVFLAY